MTPSNIDVLEGEKSEVLDFGIDVSDKNRGVIRHLIHKIIENITAFFSVDSEVAQPANVSDS